MLMADTTPIFRLLFVVVPTFQNSRFDPADSHRRATDYAHNTF
jgi:hypothetical protein